MKINDLERILRELGYILIRSSKHKVWSNGVKSIAIPHQREVNRMLSKRILKEIGHVS